MKYKIRKITLINIKSDIKDIASINIKKTNTLMNIKSESENYTFIKISKSKVVSLSRGKPEGSLFNSYYTKV